MVKAQPLPLAVVREQIITCERCPRLRDYCRRVGREKRRAFREETYWARPVPGFGDPRARLLIVGLAPAAHGANRTGRVFTGDGVGASGDFLMAALHRAGFASISTSRDPDDGLTLTDAYIAAAVRCAPPDNTPTPEEIINCLPHLDAEMAALPRLRIVVGLGKIAFDAYLQLLKRHGGGAAKPKTAIAQRADSAYNCGTAVSGGPALHDKMTALKPGSFVVHPAWGHHFDGAKDEEAIVQIMGMGPVRTINLTGGRVGGGGRGAGATAGATGAASTTPAAPAGDPCAPPAAGR